MLVNVMATVSATLGSINTTNDKALALTIVHAASNTLDT
jgi:hypothetical protein